jgi:hypothetical protein
LKEKALDEPIWGSPSRLKRIRRSALASVAVPTVEGGSDPIRRWSTTIAVVSPSLSAAIVPKTSELLPEPETPVKTSAATPALRAG